MGTEEMDKAFDGQPALNLAALCTPLEAAGWDAFTNERELMARFEYAPTNGIWTLVLDRSGRFRFVATYDRQAPQHKTATVDGREYKVLWEQLQIMTVTGQMKGAADLEEILPVLSQLAANRNPAASSCAASFLSAGKRRHGSDSESRRWRKDE